MSNECYVYDDMDHLVRKCNLQNDRFSDLSDGYYYLKIVSKDEAMNEISEQTRKFTIDRTSPIINYIPASKQIIIQAYDKIDNNPLVKYYIDNKEYYGNKIDLSNYYDSNLSIKVMATDLANNTSYDTIKVSIREGNILINNDNFPLSTNSLYSYDNISQVTIVSVFVLIIPLVIITGGYLLIRKEISQVIKELERSF